MACKEICAYNLLIFGVLFQENGCSFWSEQN